MCRHKVLEPVSKHEKLFGAVSLKRPFQLEEWAFWFYAVVLVYTAIAQTKKLSINRSISRSDSGFPPVS